MPTSNTTRRDCDIETYTLDWRDYTIAVTFERNWLTGASVGQIAHVTIEERDRRPLPVTGTG